MKVFGDTGSLTLDDLRFGRTSKVTPSGYRRLMGRQPGECTWCGGAVPKGARSWCRPVCVDEWTIRNQPAAARAAVLARDRGICASCGADCAARTAKLRALQGAVKATLSQFHRPTEPAASAFSAGCLTLAGCRRAVPLDRYYVGAPIPPTWEADHIVPVCEGGGFCGLDNYRTLCVFCHRRETAALAARRAQARRDLPADTGQVALFKGAR